MPHTCRMVCALCGSVLLQLFISAPPPPPSPCCQSTCLSKDGDRLDQFGFFTMVFVVLVLWCTCAACTHRLVQQRGPSDRAFVFWLGICR